MGTEISCEQCRYSHLFPHRSPCTSCAGHKCFSPYKKPATDSPTENSPTSPAYYSRFKIQPLDFIAVNNLDFLTGNIIKYVMRHDAKNGLEDLQKAKVYLERLIKQTKEKEKDV